MDLQAEVLCQVEQELNPNEGACGICHLTLMKLSEAGGTAISYEVPRGTVAQVMDCQGEVIGQGTDLVWAPSLLAAQIDAGLIPKPTSRNLKKLLTDPLDQQRVAEMFGYGRCVTPASKAISILWQAGGRIEISRDGLGISASLYDGEEKLISRAATGFCPICAVNISASRNKDLKKQITLKLEGNTNTGRLKYEEGLVNRVEWKQRRVFAYLEKDGQIRSMNWGCCIAYATVRAEIAAGFGGRKWNRLFKNYCDFCPLKHCWTGKSMGALGNIILDRMQQVEVLERLKKEEYLTALICKDGQMVSKGVGTLCSLSATVNAFLRSDAVEILRPSPAHGFPHHKEDDD